MANWLDTLPREVQHKIYGIVREEARKAAVKKRLREQRKCRRRCRSLVMQRGYCCENFNMSKYL